jgi:hypothetical protein
MVFYNGFMDRSVTGIDHISKGNESDNEKSTFSE